MARVEITGVGPTGAPVAVAVEDNQQAMQWVADEALRLYRQLGGLEPEPEAEAEHPLAKQTREHLARQPDESPAERELREAGFAG